MIRILLMEDDMSISASVSYYLESQGFSVDTAAGAAEGLERLREKNYHLLLLDVTLGDGNGFFLYDRIQKLQKIPVIFLTALDEEAQIVKGFDLGAEDYVTKPFHPGELLSRIKNVLRHTGMAKQEQEELTVGNVTLNRRQNKVWKGKQEVELTALEYKILSMLFENKGQTLTRTQILANIWDEAGNFVNDNTLTVYMKRLREKIEDDPGKPAVIRTVRGLGYRIGE